MNTGPIEGIYIVEDLNEHDAPAEQMPAIAATEIKQATREDQDTPVCAS